jgi:hypothetical protein
MYDVRLTMMGVEFLPAVCCLRVVCIHMKEIDFFLEWRPQRSAR